MRPAVVLPVPAAAALAERLGVELPFDLPVKARTLDERHHALAAGFDHARRAGVVTRNGIDPRLTAAFRRLQRPQIAVHVIHGDVRARQDRVVHAFGDRQTAVLAELIDHALTLTPIRPTGIAAELTAILPPAKPAEGPRSATAPRRAVAEAIETAGGLPGAFAAHLIEDGVRSGEAKVIAVALTARRAAVTEIYTDPQTCVDVLDTDHGRYVVSGYGDHVSVTVGRAVEIARKIDELINVSASRGSPPTRPPAATPSRSIR